MIVRPRAAAALSVVQLGSLLTVFCTTGEVANYEDARRADRELFRKLHGAMLARGVFLPPSQFTYLPNSAELDLQNLAATLDEGRAPARGDALPELWHWLYFLPLHRASELGPDGHAKLGQQPGRWRSVEQRGQQAVDLGAGGFLVQRRSVRAVGSKRKAHRSVILVSLSAE